MAEQLKRFTEPLWRVRVARLRQYVDVRLVPKLVCRSDADGTCSLAVIKRLSSWLLTVLLRLEKMVLHYGKWTAAFRLR